MELSKLRQIDPVKFEEYVAYIFEKQGYACHITSKSGDYGADIIAEDDKEKITIQVKRYSNNNRVGVGDIYPIHAAKDFYNCDKAILVTTSSLTRQAEILADGLDINVWQKDKLQSGTEGNQNLLSTSEKLGLAFWIAIFIISLFIF